MSGFVGKSGRYDLTVTKALYWHRFQKDSCRSLEDVLHAHIYDLGFRWQEKPGGRWVRITGPGLVDGWADRLYEAVSGAPGSVPRMPEQRWVW